MAEPRIRIFFYGSFINLDVLREVQLVPQSVEVARLPGFDIRIEPLANIEPADDACVYGIVADATHAELARLYGQDWVASYLPQAVLVETRNGAWIPALVYVAASPARSPAASDYVDRIVGPARELGFPEWYIERLEAFRSPTGSAGRR